MRHRGAWNHAAGCNCAVCLRIRNGSQRTWPQRHARHPTFSHLERDFAAMVKWEVNDALLRAFGVR